MSDIVDLEIINEKLSLALQQTSDSELSGTIALDTLQYAEQIKEVVARMSEKQDQWLSSVPALHDVQCWIDTRWHPDRETQRLQGIVETGTNGIKNEYRLDSLTAAFKLLVAAWNFDTRLVVQAAKNYSITGLLETQSYYMLKGQPVSKRIPLDEYCTLTPYEEALESLREDAYVWDLVQILQWPPEVADDMCALECKTFENRSKKNCIEHHESYLLQYGPEKFALMLGLVWGNGFRKFGEFHTVSAPAAAAIPCFRASTIGGGSSKPITFVHRDLYRDKRTSRPLAVQDVGRLMNRYSQLSDQSRARVDLALRRVRDGTERSEMEDKVIDLCIALEALFIDTENRKQKKRIASRGSWYFADSTAERNQTRLQIEEFYDYRSDIVHGKGMCNPLHSDRNRQHELFRDVENVVRTNVMTMITTGRPQDWDQSKTAQSLRYSPPRLDTEIRSVKSDTLSWSVYEQRRIDRALNDVWKPTIENAPTPTPDSVAMCNQGIDWDLIKQLNHQGVYYVIIAPVLLYMVHPLWIERASEPLDDHTRYYCERDIKEHLHRWKAEAHHKSIYQFDLPLEDATSYLPERFDFWTERLSRDPNVKEKLPAILLGTL